MRHLDQRKRSCVRVWDPRKLHVTMYENAQTIVSWLLPKFKGFYNTHAQLASVSYKYAKRRLRYVYMRKHWLAHFSYTETVTCMHVLRNDEICFTSMDDILKRSEQIKGTVFRCSNWMKLKGQCSDVKVGCGTSVEPSLNPQCLS